MVYTTYVLVSIKFNKRYKNLLCIIPEELSYSKDLIKKEIEKLYENLSNYIFISFIDDKVGLELLKSSNYIKTDLSKISLEDVNLNSYQCGELIRKSINNEYSERVNYYKNKYCDIILEDFNKNKDYNVGFENLKVDDSSDNGVTCYSYSVIIVYKKEEISKKFKVSGWNELNGDYDSDCDYNYELEEYIKDDYNELLEIIKDDLEELIRFFN